jgi:hypothetical protein
MANRRESDVAIRPQNRCLVPGGKPGTKAKKTRLKEALLSAGGNAALADPMEFFKMVMADEKAESSRRDYAASQLLPYFHAKKPALKQVSGEGGGAIILKIDKYDMDL